MLATTVGIRMDLVAAAFSLCVFERFTAQLKGYLAASELQYVATQLDTQILTRTDVDTKTKDSAYRYFIHGSSLSLWMDATGINPQAGLTHKLDFGLGFYTFALRPTGLDHASKRATDIAGRRGGYPFVMLVRIPTTAFNALRRRTFPGARIPNSPGQAAYLAFVNRYRDGYNGGITGYDVVSGPVAGKPFGASQWSVNPKFPDQYKFETWAGPFGVRPGAFWGQGAFWGAFWGQAGIRH